MTERVNLIREALNSAEQALSVTEAELRNVESRTENLRKEVAGLRAALAAHDSVEAETAQEELPDPGPRPSFHFVFNKWQLLNRSEAVERVLREQGPDGLHRKQLTELLQEKGRDDKLKDVSAALAYLKREHRVAPLGDGVWRLASLNGSSSKGGDV